MSVVIVGGNDRMVGQYRDLCREYDCATKVFTQMPGTLKKKIGSPDIMIVFTSTVSHNMVTCAVSEAKRTHTRVVRCRSSSMAALRNILQECTDCRGDSYA